MEHCAKETETTRTFAISFNIQFSSEFHDGQQIVQLAQHCTPILHFKQLDRRHIISKRVCGAIISTDRPQEVIL